MGDKISLLGLLLLISITATAQTGIGTTTPNASAKLEVASTNKGFLPPRVALTAANVFAPVTGLSGASELATAAGTIPNNVVPGYYYWNGSVLFQIAGDIVPYSAFVTSATSIKVSK